MKKILIALFIVQGFCNLNLLADDSTRVLFIGNSITYFNNMPFTFQDISNNLGKKVKVSMYAPGGTGFINHVSDANVYDLFRGSWDVVVLQPGSSESAGMSSTVDQTIVRGKTLIDSIKKYNACAKIYLYQIPYGVPSSSGWNTYFSVQTTFRDSVTKMADSLKVQMIAAGECVRAYYTKYQNLALHNMYNDIHPGPLGSYLIASACYNTIFQDSINNCTYYSTIPQDSALKFFAISDSVILENKSNWRINSYNLHTDFLTTPSGLTVNFNNASSNATNYLWKFGDGAISMLPNPQHVYSNTGTYTVTLYSSDLNCADSISKVIMLNATDLASTIATHLEFKVYPNPATDVIYISSINAEINRIKLYDISGRVLVSQDGNKKTSEINMKDLSSGVYYLEVNNQKIKLIKL